MKEYDFRRYIQSKILLNLTGFIFTTNLIHPLFTNLYESKFSMIDYIIDGYNVELIQNSHSQLFNGSEIIWEEKIRPISSNYFDLILEKIGN